MTTTIGSARPGTTAPSAIAARGLVRTFGDFQAVDGIDLDVSAGEIYGLLGPNGAGKSTTVRMLCTLLRPTDGSASVAGFDVVERPDAVRMRIGAALQEAALDPRQTGRELLRLQGRLYGLDTGEVDRRLDALTVLIDIGDAIDRLISTYSGGMKRRLDLAAALVHNPEVLFLDEPTTGLDPVSRARVWDEVRALNERLGMTILLTTQYLEEADALVDRVGIIDGGRLVAEGTPAELKRQIGTDLVIVGIDGDRDLATRVLADVEGIDVVGGDGAEVVLANTAGSAAVGAVATALSAASIELRDLTMRSPTLDDVFLEMTGNRMAIDEGDGVDDLGTTHDTQNGAKPRPHRTQEVAR
jgi:ABC-2 type transport system ATP-binding protein